MEFWQTPTATATAPADAAPTFTRLYKTRKACPGGLPADRIIEAFGSASDHERFVGADGHPGRPIPYDGPFEFPDDTFHLDLRGESMIPNAPVVDRTMGELQVEYGWRPRNSRRPRTGSDCHRAWFMSWTHFSAVRLVSSIARSAAISSSNGNTPCACLYASVPREVEVSAMTCPICGLAPAPFSQIDRALDVIAASSHDTRRTARHGATADKALAAMQRNSTGVVDEGSPHLQTRSSVAVISPIRAIRVYENPVTALDASCGYSARRREAPSQRAQAMRVLALRPHPKWQRR